jgi:hypothetical protein
MKQKFEIISSNIPASQKNDAITLRCTFEQKLEFNDLRDEFLRELGYRPNYFELVMSSMRVALDVLRQQKDNEPSQN